MGTTANPKLAEIVAGAKASRAVLILFAVLARLHDFIAIIDSAPGSLVYAALHDAADGQTQEQRGPTN